MIRLDWSKHCNLDHNVWFWRIQERISVIKMKFYKWNRFLDPSRNFRNFSIWLSNFYSAFKSKLSLALIGQHYNWYHLSLIHLYLPIYLFVLCVYIRDQSKLFLVMELINRYLYRMSNIVPLTTKFYIECDRRRYQSIGNDNCLN